MSCRCGACLTPVAQRGPREAFIAEVHTVGLDGGPGFWSARAQGKLAALEGRPITDNPWYRDSHFNRWAFERGYKSVQAPAYTPAQLASHAAQEAYEGQAAAAEGRATDHQGQR